MISVACRFLYDYYMALCLPSVRMRTYHFASAVTLDGEV